MAVVMYKVDNNLSPGYLKRIFTNISCIHSQNLMNSQSNCHIPRPRPESAKGSLHCKGPVLWNKIPFENWQYPNLSDFKKFIKRERFVAALITVFFTSYFLFYYFIS